MSEKTIKKVLIGGNVYQLGGYESEEYLQRVATYINNKLDELSEMDGYKKLSADYKHVLLALNIADNYFKAKKQGSILESEIEGKDKELYDIKHELVAAQIQNETTDELLEVQDKEIQELQKKIIRLETELADTKRTGKR